MQKLKSDFFDFFQRGYCDIATMEDLYENNQITQGMSTPDIQASSLFEDCFGHHVKDHYTEFPEDIKVIHSNSKRLASPDQLTAYFMTHLYKVPKITRINCDEINCDEDFSKFMKIITDNPIHLDGNKGTNNINFLVGEAGEGKTLFCNKIKREIYRNEQNRHHQKIYNYYKNSQTNEITTYKNLDSYKLLPIYIDFEEAVFKDKHLSEDINFPNLIDTIYSKIMTSLTDYNLEGVFSSFKQREKNVSNQISAFDLNRFIAHLSKNKIRLFLLIDNLDRYYFHYSKHIFFQNHRTAQEQKINRNIQDLIQLFTGSTIDNLNSSLNDSGLCILFVARTYVYSFLVANNILDPIQRNHYAYQIQNDHFEILNSRMKLYAKAAKKIIIEIPGKKNDFNLSVYKKLFKDIIKDKNNNINHVKTISELGRQGNRSFIDFISTLKVLSTDDTLINRFIVRKQRAVIMLYILNKKQKYTQAENHFPNIYLNDSTVCSLEVPEEFQMEYKPHLHTYWLKYFILKYLEKKDSTLDKVLILFNRNTNGYPKELITLALGSLNTDNDFKCIRLKEDIKDIDIKRRTIKITNRGKYLLLKEKHTFLSQSVDIEFCFNFLYLQLMIDDYLLALPKELFNKIFLENLSYQYLLSNNLKTYKDGAANMIKHKAKAVLYFIKVLKASLKVEKDFRQDIFDKLSVQGINSPDFDAIIKALYSDLNNLRVTVYSRDLNQKFFDELNEIRDNKEIDITLVNIFNNYFQTAEKKAYVRKYESDD